MAIFAGRWKHHTEYVMFVQWRMNAKAAIRMRYTFAHAVAKLAHRTLGMGMAGWKEKVRMQRRVRSCARRALLRVKNRSLAFCMSRWVDGIAKKRDERDVVKRVYLRIVHHNVARAFHQWSNDTDAWFQEKRRARLMVQNAMARWANHRVARAFIKWTTLVRDQMALEAARRNTAALTRLMQRAFDRNVRVKQRGAISKWRTFTAGAALKEANERAMAWWQQCQKMSILAPPAPALAISAPTRRPPPAPKVKPRVWSPPGPVVRRKKMSTKAERERAARERGGGPVRRRYATPATNTLSTHRGSVAKISLTPISIA
jgi:hypothetical protein